MSSCHLAAGETDCNWWGDCSWSFHVLKTWFFQDVLLRGKTKFAMALHWLWTTNKPQMSPDDPRPRIRFRSFFTIWGLLWCVLHLDQLGEDGAGSCFVWWWGLKGPARGRTALDGHWEGLAGRKLGLIKTNKKWRLQRKCREQLLTESLVRGSCWCHLGEDRQPGWALLWGVDHSHHSHWEWERPQGRTSHCPTRILCWCAQF